MNTRRLHDNEKRLIRRVLVGLPEGQGILEKIDCYEVEELNDGGMGSLSIIAPSKRKRHFGKILAETQLQDEDGVPVFVSIITDSTGDLYELDVWKADFSALRKPVS